ncbi:MAG: DNA-3-methyladenine glycosylase [Candidatus Saccharimonadales bacterium]
MKQNLQQTYQAAADHLRANDPYLASLIDKHGLYTAKPHTNYYQDLVEAIIGQQLSVKAARTIKGRFQDLFGGKLPTPEQILEQDIETLRSVGLSRPKAGYIQDLAVHVLDGRIKFDHLPKLSNDEIVKELTDVKGIGEWTVHMFLMFCMGRLDVLPIGDLGIKNGIRGIYDLDHAPSPDEIKKIADKYHWHPYESIASWYVWRSLENEPL